MFEFKMTINGKSMTETNIHNEIEQAVFDSIVEAAKKEISSVITEEEASQITIDIIGKDINDLSLRVEGPDVITDKINKILS